MTREEIKNTPEIVDFMLSESVMSESKEKLHKRLDEICNLAIKALEQEPKIDILDKIRAEIKGMTPTYHNPDWSITDLVPISEVLKLVDKCKAESEDKE